MPVTATDSKGRFQVEIEMKFAIKSIVAAVAFVAAGAASAATVERIVSRGEPVYGINTGFGKLASIKIDAADTETLQRNLILSHCCGVGDPRRRRPSFRRVYG